ncbi:Zinc finger CCHC-type superfamily [Arabidopsis thaliana x Arabidopsis arenosa]|uniref:Zinc finger CCHC-type superfamily n=1 Tax=Arabidopsis thaliana x Arabidopsis arenosa TaxID=1240361 RepID=A0A8T1XEL0_9BRAS|nr:Zinc finger CCHC-type superfamily [Arabidopsis thaliana x Arabidopsis arenosa]
MESYHGLDIGSRVILNDGNYGFWKSRMKAVIRGIDVYAWKAILEKWEEPKIKDESGAEVAKPEKDWTNDELKKSKYNAKALTAIHINVGRNQFELIQGYETAKEAWDILQNHFEGTTKVKNSRKDMLASRFENLKMEERDSISDFSSKISSLAQEALTLGKKYKDKKLVKKFLRCLPSRFMAYKTALSVSHNTEDLSFGDVVGMLQAHEMELEGVKKVKNPKDLALTSLERKTQEVEEDDPKSFLFQRLDQLLRKVEEEQGQRRFSSSKKYPEEGKTIKKANMQCHECLGYGHFKYECPTFKKKDVKCFGCKGIGHTQHECVSNQKKRKEKSIQRIEEDSEEESDVEEEVNHFVTLLGKAEFEGGEEVLGSESEEEHEVDFAECYKEVRETLIKIGQENQALVKEKCRLDELVELLQNELRDKTKICQESMKEKLTVSTRVGKSNRGLGYIGQKGSQTGQIKFVAESVSPPNPNKYESNASKGTGCYFCGKNRHIKAYCYKFRDRISRLKHQGKFSWNGFRSQIWVKKSDLYQITSEHTSGRIGSKSGKSRSTSGSGYSRNMTATATEPALKPATEPAAEPATEPAAEPALKPAAEPALKPAAEPALKPVSELASEGCNEVESVKYKMLYEQWLNLVEENSVLTREKLKIEAKVAETQKYAIEKEEEASQARVQLEETYKNLRMLNNGTKQLDHILNIGKTDRYGLGFKGNLSKSDTMFISGGY